METINDRIRIVLKDSGLTMAEFGKKINVSQPTVSTICSGKSNPSERTIIDICEKFKICEDWLRHGTGPKVKNVTTEEELQEFFSGVLAMDSPSSKAFIAALSSLPPNFWGAVADFAQEYVAKLKEQENDKKTE